VTGADAEVGARARLRRRVVVEQLTARAFTVPTDAPEADGTLRWDETTVVLVEAHAGGHTGFGYSYAAGAARALVDEVLTDVVVGRDALSPTAAWGRMRRAVRNLGYPGVASGAIGSRSRCPRMICGA